MVRLAMAEQQQFAGLSRLLRLRGRLAGDPAAGILHALLIGLMVWAVLLGSAGLAFVAKPLAATALVAPQIIAYLIALRILRGGNLRPASVVYIAGVAIHAAILTWLNGGINSPVVVLLVSVPISAAWLLGFRAALVSVAVCLCALLALALAAHLGVRNPRYLPETPLGTWLVFLQSTIMATLPVMLVLRTLNQSLAAARRWIEELRETQEALRRERDLVNRIMETSPAGIVAVNRDGRINFVNSSGERIFGLSRNEVTRRVYNDPAWQATSHDGIPYPDDEYPFRQVQRYGHALHDVRLAIAKPDGRRVLLSVNAAPVWTADGKFDGMVASLEDMTERARVEGELRKYREGLEEIVRQRTAELVAARDQAMAANKAKSVFLANISHELRTPLNAILGFAGLIADSEGLPPAHLAKIRRIQHSGEHLLELINDILDTSKIEAGGAAVENAPTDLSDLVLRVVDMMRARAEEKSLRLNVVQMPAFPRFARTDGAKLRQILINLVSNAIKYTERGHVLLRLDAQTTGRLLLNLEVADTGIGIAVEDQERIFEPFVQLGSRHAGGTGLGLALTRQYVQLMGGSISVDSAPGRGSIFRAVLPAESSDPVSAAACAESGRVTGLAPGQPRYRVLIVEDEQENRVLLQELLAKAGFDTRAVEDGAAAIDTFRSWQPEFIWMDWRLPVMNGQLATKAIRAMRGGRHVKIAAVTASAFVEERAAILAAGVDEFVRKPYRPGDIFDCMARLLGVRYTLEERRPFPEPQSESFLTPAALATLPEALRQELGDALISLDVTRVTEAIGRASALDERLGAALSRHADSLAFTAILKALDALRDRIGKEAI